MRECGVAAAVVSMSVFSLFPHLYSVISIVDSFAVCSILIPPRGQTLDAHNAPIECFNIIYKQSILMPEILMYFHHR